MDVSSVSSSISAALAASVQAQTRARPAQPDAAQIQSTQQSQQAQGSQSVQGTPAVDESEASARVETEKTRPTVNINGQTVGTRVNTTA